MLRGIKSSIKKWKEVKANIIKKNEGIHYHNTYWCSCGYCNVFSCSECPMHDIDKEHNIIGYKKKNAIYCDIAFAAISLADSKDWRNALVCVNIVLDKMNKDLYDYSPII